MAIKSDKTFEEVVERLVALVRPEPKEADTTDPQPHTPEPRDPDHSSPRSRRDTPGNRRPR